MHRTVGIGLGLPRIGCWTQKVLLLERHGLLECLQMVSLLLRLAQIALNEINGVEGRSCVCKTKSFKITKYFLIISSEPAAALLVTLRLVFFVHFCFDIFEYVVICSVLNDNVPIVLIYAVRPKTKIKNIRFKYYLSIKVL